jgi:CubicO group peptidase (beta-lactamase class C family)
MTRTGLTALCVLYFCASPELGAQSLAGRFEPAFALLRQAVENGEVPGGIALVGSRDRVLRHEAFGVADPEHRIPFTEDTLCWMASITKTVTAAAAMLLVEEGRLNLDTPATKYLPEFKAHSFTIRQLMSHTSGLGVNPPTRAPGPLGGALQDSWLVQPIPDIVAAIDRAPLEFEPGSKVQYSNQAPFVLARVIEVVSGKPYARFVRERLLSPLGMKDSSYAPQTEQASRVAPIFSVQNGKRNAIFRFKPGLIVNTAPDGGLFSNPGELVRFVRMFVLDDGSVLSKKSVREMLTTQAPGWGLGWAVRDGYFEHRGSSGTAAWFDRGTGLIAILFFQYHDDRGTVERLQNAFWKAVRQ